MCLTLCGQVAAFVAELALDKHIPFAEALELVAVELERVRQFESPDLHLKEATE